MATARERSGRLTRFRRILRHWLAESPRIGPGRTAFSFAALRHALFSAPAAPPQSGGGDSFVVQSSDEMEAGSYMKATRLFSFLCLIALCATTAGRAAQPGQPQVVLSVDVKEEISAPDPKGNLRVVRKGVERASPGDVLVYTLTYTNFGKEPAANARVDDPIPSGTVLLPASVLGERAGITFSVDGGKSFAAYPVMKTVSGPDGKPASVEAPAESYTHIRWTAQEPIAPGESRSAAFKVIVR